MLMDKLLRNGQPQTCTFGAPGDHREKDVLHDVFRNARAIVDNVDAANERIMASTDGELPLNARAQTYHAVTDMGLKQCLHGVAHDIEKSLNQQFFVTHYVGNTGVVIAHKLNGVAFCMNNS